MSNKKHLLIAILGIICVLLLTAGITYAWFNYARKGVSENKITSGAITFYYKEESQGISLSDAMPMTDEEGMSQNKYFDFKVVANVHDFISIPYTITAKVDSSSTLPIDYVKVYLTDQENNEVEPVSVLGELDQYSHASINITGDEKILHEASIMQDGETTERFRLRMWVSDDINMNEDNTGEGTYTAATFKIKVNVYGEGIVRNASDRVEVTGDSILSILQKNSKLTEGVYYFKAGGQTYPVHLIDEDSNTISVNTTYGDEEDLSDGTDYANNMVIVRHKGDLTINQNVTVGPIYNNYGGPKGFLIYVTGSLTNNGTIDNSHGAYAEGQDVILWKNADGSYEVVPALGASGGTGNFDTNGNKGQDGVNQNARATAGGGAGGGYNEAGGTGGAGSSYSGGAGGGASGRKVGETGSSIGGKGGDAKAADSTQYGGGGAGNPGGAHTYGTSYNGDNGTGGLLVIYADTFENNGILTAKGANGGKGGDAGGGASGGGSINIFVNQITIGNVGNVNVDLKYDEMLGNYSVDGGTSSSGKANHVGGSGGTGTISMGSISNGTYYGLKQAIARLKDEYLSSAAIKGDSILSILNSHPELTTGNHLFKVETSDSNEYYFVHLIDVDTDTISANTAYGDDNDISNGTDFAQNMVIARRNGDLTINSNVTVGPTYNNYGGPKGFVLYVSGTLTNNGTIDNSHGAYSPGQNVILWKNSDNDYEIVPAVGGVGGTGVDSSHGNKGQDGSEVSSRATAGGGAGGGYNATGGSGGTGTSFSGGTGGGAGGRATGQNGAPYGGKGGNAVPKNSSQYNGGGAGNPGGTHSYGTSYNGGNGTGGLLIVYANNLINNNIISANGTDGGYGEDSGGGSSGGGSVNIFYQTSITKKTEQANGGARIANDNYGGQGGTGTVSYKQISFN